MCQLGLTGNPVITHPSVVSGPLAVVCGQSTVGRIGLAVKGVRILDFGFQILHSPSWVLDLES